MLEVHEHSYDIRTPIQVRLCGDSTFLHNIKKFLTRYKVSPGELYSSMVYVCYES